MREVWKTSALDSLKTMPGVSKDQVKSVLETVAACYVDAGGDPPCETYQELQYFIDGLNY